MKFADIWGKIQVPSNKDDYPDQSFSPKVLKAFGIMCFVCLVASGLLLIPLGVDITKSIEQYFNATQVLVAVAIGIMACGSIVLFGIMGKRFVKGVDDLGERMAIATVTLVIGSFLLMMVIYGLSWIHVVYIVELVFLAIVTVYLDPELAEERTLLKKAQAMEPAERNAFEKKIDNRKPRHGYITLNFFNLFWIFVVCCFLGLVVETVFHFIVFHGYQDRAGLLFGPFSPIYGFGGLLMTVALNRFHDKNIVVIFLVSAVIGGAFEFFASWAMQSAFGIVAWNYSGTFMNIDGRTNLQFMCYWGLLGLVWVKALLPMLLWTIDKIPWKIRYSLTTVFAVFMVVDIVMTVQTIDCWFMRESGNVPSTGLEIWMSQHFDNNFMQERFQTMDMHPGQAARI